MHLGDVATFADVKNDKEQALKPLEEAAEVFGAWQRMRSECVDDCTECHCPCINHDLFVDECIDVIQAVVNLLSVTHPTQDLHPDIMICKMKNERRGRTYAG